MRKKANRVRWLACVLFLVAASCAAATGRVICVDADAVDAGNGSSWADTYWCLQDALASARPGDVLPEDWPEWMKRFKDY